MKDKNTASPSNQKNTLKILAFLAILLLVLIAFWSTKWDTSLTSIKDDGSAAITLWLWTGSGSSGGGISSYFNKTTDLEITILSSGFINKAGDFVDVDVLSSSLKGAIRIQVKNNGKNASTNWFIDAKLPTDPPFTYLSDEFKPLQKNEIRTFLLEFDKVTTKELGEIEVIVISLDEEKETKNNTFISVVPIVP